MPRETSFVDDQIAKQFGLPSWPPKEESTVERKEEPAPPRELSEAEKSFLRQMAGVD